MSEEDITRIEKKVDLLYRMGLDENFSYKNYLDEFIPLFNLSVEMEKMVGLIIVKVKEVAEKGEEVVNKLNKLKSDYKAGNVLVKEEERTRTLIYHQEEKQKALLQIVELYNGVKYGEEALREELLMINLKEKVGIKLSEEEDFRHKETLERELKDAIDWLQTRLKEYKKKFD